MLQLPTIIHDMNITSDANQTQLWSVIPYAVATPITGMLTPSSVRSQGLLLRSQQCWLRLLPID